jgi:hypothetical protein
LQQQQNVRESDKKEIEFMKDVEIVKGPKNVYYDDAEIWNDFEAPSTF